MSEPQEPVDSVERVAPPEFPAADAFCQQPTIEAAEALAEAVVGESQYQRDSKAVRATMLLGLADGTAREESRYRELAFETAEKCETDIVRANLYLELIQHVAGLVNSQEATHRAQEALGFSPWPSKLEVFPPEALGLRGRDYI